MRTDCEINPGASLRLPQIPLCSPGRNAYARRGDVVAWRATEEPDSSCHTGRVIGVVARCADLPHPHLCVAMMLGDLACEHWVDPKLVYDCYTIRTHEKLAWLWGPDFLSTPVGLARQCWDLTADKLKGVKGESH